jgi:hypothetical protein
LPDFKVCSFTGKSVQSRWLSGRAQGPGVGPRAPFPRRC